MLSKLAAKIFNWFKDHAMKNCNHMFTHAFSKYSSVICTDLVCTKCGFTPCVHGENK